MVETRHYTDGRGMFISAEASGMGVRDVEFSQKLSQRGQLFELAYPFIQPIDPVTDWRSYTRVFRSPDGHIVGMWRINMMSTGAAG